MADYSRYLACGCSYYGPHEDNCIDHPTKGAQNKLAIQWRPQGLIWAWTHRAYVCRRGCGTLVWNPDEHVRNVCIEFNPVIGE